jgi:uncharacterized protein (TIGR00251 family)
VILEEGAPWARRVGDGWSLTIRVQPGARTSEVVGAHGEALRIRLAAPAVDGKANAALVAFLAAQLDRPPSTIEIVRGHRSRTKVVHIAPIARND